ncbi:O-methyltransferase [Actinoplanes sp. NPDC051494]|uniref:O-methyltransferase n=1 Tax=Actinoplanes sp. NPDC051494 TaxID=3363907 RepID=UPI0037A2B15E
MANCSSWATRWATCSGPWRTWRTWRSRVLPVRSSAAISDRGGAEQELAVHRCLPGDPQPGASWPDFAFVDADQTGYPGYYAELVPRLRPGGLLVLDNVLQGGEIVDPAAEHPSVLAMRVVNDLVVADGRVESVMLPVRDGVTLVRKR